MVYICGMRYLWMLAGLLVMGWPQDTSEGAEEAPSSAPTPSRRIRWKSNSYLEVGYNRFMGLPADLATSVQGLGSIKLNFQPMEMLRIGKFYVGSGLGIAIREVRFEKNAVLYRDTTGFLTYTFDTLVTIQGYSAKSKFQLGYLRIPLELGILHKGFQLAVFGYGDLLVWVRQKRKYSTSDESIKQIQAGNKNFGTESLQYGVGGRVGYDWISAFFNFNLSPLWRSTKGPDNVRAIQVGIYIYRSFYKRSRSSIRWRGYSS